ncbi:MAG TPA: isoaspartyl peptidase/L-asparaginase [Paucimonas sp.]|nr:isoaspartyl peptidase/L-asparaginase [Paucimonas sp.]
MTNPRYALAIHGGAGTIAHSAPEIEAPYHAALKEAAAAGEAVLAAGGTALEAVTAAVVALEDCPLFNAGRGSVYTSDATHEMDASVMDGRDLRAGAVTCVRTIRNPVLLARAVMEWSGHVLLTSDGAERFARECGIETAPSEYFAVASRLEQLRRARAEAEGAKLDHDLAAAPAEPLDPDRKFGTVGAVARDRQGNLASAVSTGGMTNKRPGRVGDTPVIGAGCYADNRTVAVAATGTGEYFMRSVAAYDLAARIDYANASLEEAARQTVFERLAAIGGRGGLIAVDRDGNIALLFNTTGMYRAWVREGEPITAAIF